MACLLEATFQAFVLENEMLSHVQRAIRGIEVNHESLAYDVIREAVIGEMHFPGGDHIPATMERDFHFSHAGDPAMWEDRYAPDIRFVAREEVHRLHASGPPEHVDAASNARIRERFKNLLPPILEVEMHQ